MDGLVLNPATESQILNFLQAPSHALLLSGLSGVGKQATALQIATKLLKLSMPFEQYAYKKVIAPVEGKAIGIAPIRELEHFLSLKIPNKQKINRAIIIVDSHLLTHEAQNALLKTLEEPPAGTVLILTTSESHALLPTIRSRVQQIMIRPPSQQYLSEHFTQQGSTLVAIEQAYNISGGLPGLMHAMLTSQDHPLLLATERARRLLKESLYERLCSVDELAKNKPLAIDMLTILQQMSRITLQSASHNAAENWQRILQASYAAQSELATNTQPKLVLTNLMLSL